MNFGPGHGVQNLLAWQTWKTLLARPKICTLGIRTLLSNQINEDPGVPYYSTTVTLVRTTGKLGQNTKHTKHKTHRVPVVVAMEPSSR